MTETAPPPFKALDNRIQALSDAASNETVTFRANLSTHKHLDGQQAIFLQAVRLPSDGNGGYDEEALPFFQVRFSDGRTMDIAEEELVTQSPAVEACVAGVCHEFAVARQLGYAGPGDLETCAPPEVKQAYLDATEASPTVRGRYYEHLSDDCRWVLQRLERLREAAHGHYLTLQDGTTGEVLGMLIKGDDASKLYMRIRVTEGPRVREVDATLDQLPADMPADVERYVAGEFYADALAKRHGFSGVFDFAERGRISAYRALVDQLAVSPETRLDAAVWFVHGNPHASIQSHWKPGPERQPSGDTAGGKLPAQLPLKAAFLAAFELLCERDYPAILQPNGYSDRDDLCTDYDNAIGSTLAMLEIDEPEGDDLDWKGVLHDWIEDKWVHIGEAFEASDEDEEEPEGMRP